MKLLYKPFAVIVGVIGGLISRKVFDALWARFDDRKPPDATVEEASWGKVLGSAAFQAATFAVTRATVERVGAQGFAHVTGFWPGDKRAEKADKKAAKAEKKAAKARK